MPKLSKKQTVKKVALPKIVEHVVDTIIKPVKKLPFGGKGGRKKKKPELAI